jgi:flagellar basal-body rod protein FlgB
MAINFDKALGIYDDALKFRSARAAVLADNLANADTPGYKAKDITFQGVMNGEVQMRQSQTHMRTSDDRHFSIGSSTSQYDTLYRTPQQPSIDGNTVEEQIENAEYMKNSLDFQASFNFLNSRFKGLTAAIKGE